MYGSACGSSAAGYSAAGYSAAGFSAAGYSAGGSSVAGYSADDSSEQHHGGWLQERNQLMSQVEKVEERRKRAVKELMILKKMTSNVVESEKLKVAKLEGELKVEEKMHEVLRSELEAEKRRCRQAEINVSEEKLKKMKVEADLEEEIQKRKKAEEEVGKLKRLASANEMKRTFLKRYAEKEAEVAVAKKLKLAEEELYDIDEWSQFSPDTGVEGALVERSRMADWSEGEEREGKMSVDAMEAANSTRGIVLEDKGSCRKEVEGSERVERQGMMSLGVTEVASGARGEEALVDKRSSREEVEGLEGMERQDMMSLGVTEVARCVVLEGEEALVDRRSSREEVQGSEVVKRQGNMSVGITEVASRSTRLVSEGKARESEQPRVEEELWMSESQGTMAEVSHSSL